MMAQYLQIKQQHPLHLLFYRLGDFYELFFDDAILASKTLDITLTKRGKHEALDIPMCGVPFHSADIYIQKLIKAGLSVAIVEQMESPEEAKKRGAKSVVERSVVRIVTPGTLLEENLLSSCNNNYLLTIASDKFHKIALSWLDISTAEFACCLIDVANLAGELTRLSPVEILMSEKLLQKEGLSAIFTEWRSKVTPQVDSNFDHKKCLHHLQDYFKLHASYSFNDFTPGLISACGATVEYVRLTQKKNLPLLNMPCLINQSHFLQIDSSTRRNLELTSSLSGNSKLSLRAMIDYTVTSMGARLLSHYFAAPLTCVQAIQARLRHVEFLKAEEELRCNLRIILKTIPDTERSLSRLASSRYFLRDLVAIQLTLEGIMQISALLEQSGAGNLHNYQPYHLSFDQLRSQLRSALSDNMPIHIKDGGFVRVGYNPKLDQLIAIRDNSSQMLNDLRDRYRIQTGVATLKLEYNNVLGFFLEATGQQASKVVGEEFIHKQTLTSGVRYVTLELKELEKELLSVKGNIARLEQEILEELVLRCLTLATDLQNSSAKLAYLDVVAGFAELALQHNYVCPKIDHSYNFQIIQGRHPVVEQLERRLEAFTPNDCNLGAGQNLWLITGPNMAGKSTFLRQNALITIMAQMGCFVPAESAHIGVVDRIFSRIGAADDLSQGRSTFMVEMVETATILTSATDKSLIILDEIGRGTSTYDGVSIAWSCLEHIHNKLHSRALFATHYHELTHLEQSLKFMRCYSMKVQEWQGKVIFMHSIIAGPADRSYGIHVAELAGLPRTVISRAKELLAALEQEKMQVPDLPLFAIAAPVVASDTLLRSKLQEINLDELKPREALDLLYQLKELL
jgi:DNA mismatch repair protein MutS